MYNVDRNGYSNKEDCALFTVNLGESTFLGSHAAENAPVSSNHKELYFPKDATIRKPTPNKTCKVMAIFILPFLYSFVW